MARSADQSGWPRRAGSRTSRWVVRHEPRRRGHARLGHALGHAREAQSDHDGLVGLFTARVRRSRLEGRRAAGDARAHARHEPEASLRGVFISIVMALGLTGVAADKATDHVWRTAIGALVALRLNWGVSEQQISRS
jgi:hypothetical protein